MQTANTVNNDNTESNKLKRLMQWFLVANTSQTRIFKGREQRIYSYKKIIQSTPFNNLEEVLHDELRDYLRKHFEQVDIKVHLIPMKDGLTVTSNESANYIINIDISVTGENGKAYTLSEVFDSEQEQEELFRHNT